MKKATHVLLVILFAILYCAVLANTQTQLPLNSNQTTGAAPTATALANNGSNCSAGAAAGGVDASGAAEDCTTYATASSTTTFTNKTMDVEATGNSFTDVIRLEFPFAGCVGNTASSIWDDSPLRTEGAATCVAGTNMTRGVIALDADADETVGQIAFQLPAGWTGNIDLDIYWRAAATSGNVAWDITTVCTAVGETLDASFNAAQEIVDATQGTTNQLNIASQSALTTTGCAAGERMTVEIFRDADDATNDTMTGDAVAIAAVFTLRVTK